MYDDEIKQILIDSIQNQKQAFSDLRKLFMALIISNAIVACTAIGGFFLYESQFEYTYDTQDDLAKAVSTEGDNSNASLIEGDQYNDKSQHTE